MQSSGGRTYNLLMYDRAASQYESNFKLTVSIYLKCPELGSIA